MNRMEWTISLLVLLLAAGLTTAADKPVVIDLWPGKPAGDDAGKIGEEKYIEIKSAPNIKWLTNVTKPTLTVFRPAKDKDTGAAALICPGGGYHNLAWDREGTEVAEWLNSLGVTGIVLKYRCPRRPGDVKGEPPAGPLKDAQRAVRLVRGILTEARRLGMETAIGFEPAEWPKEFKRVLPGTEDYIWVYSGKGSTKEHAMASALMESIERYSSLPSGGQRKFTRSSYAELSKACKVLHPDRLVEPVRFEYRDDMLMDWLAGYDLASGEEVMVPASAALFRYTPPPPAVNPFAYFHTNGLASGNVMEEAICHALCEVIERDAMSLGELRASAIPFHILRIVLHSLNSAGLQVQSIPVDRFVDDPGVFPDVDISGIEFHPAKDLVDKFYRAGISLTIKDITSDIGIPTFNASSVEWSPTTTVTLQKGTARTPMQELRFSVQSLRCRRQGPLTYRGRGTTCAR